MSADFSQQRAKMVEGQLRTQDVTHVPLLEAMREIPREAFVPGRRKALAYIDEDLEISPAGEGAPARFLMEPAPFAKLVQLAGVKPSDLVLDVGCATGYSSAVLSKVASFVVALECDPQLAESASARLADLDCVNVTVVTGPLEKGHPDEAPYDLIFIGGAVDLVPDELISQLGEGGRLVAVVGHGNSARAELFVKEDGVVSSRRAFNTAVRPLPGFSREAGFVF
ncbi:protein-L-isoaspartate O-methyltransferase family protein [Nitratireductor luteus]|uniref:protein-L-isoaspartate O-methyltransferase family protein n=1 Tax=Nitratireductor luteus TaxID=2976980 RepID=UPI00223F5971|nr:protein-L-isoaspartate O-methyltransferase [Nitratireductor luteus]